MTDPGRASETPRQRRLEIFVDGTNFEINSRPLIGGKLVDVPNLARKLAASLPPTNPGHLLVKLRYCTSPAPHLRTTAFQRGFFDHLRSTPAVELILGRHVRRDTRGVGPRRYEEKETDVNVAIHMVAGAYEDRYDVALLVSGDTDMVPAMRMVRRLGKRVVWAYLPEQATTRPLKRESDDQYLMTEAFLRECEHFRVIRE